jgi:hypothetical protein
MLDMLKPNRRQSPAAIAAQEEAARRAAGIANAKAGGAYTPTVAPNAPLPSLLDDPEYAAGSARLTELQTEFSALDREISSLTSRLNMSHNTEREQRLAEAAALTSHPTAAAVTERFSAEALRMTLGEKQARCALLRDAITLQRALVDAARNRASLAGLAVARPHHERLVLRATEAAIELSRAMQAEADYRAALEERGLFTSQLRQVAPPGEAAIGQIGHEWSPIRRHLRALAEAGYEVPRLPELLDGEQKRSA